MMNCCLAQLQTFSVVQGIIMNRKLHNFEIPTPSLSVIPLIIMLSSIPLYERLHSGKNIIFNLFGGWIGPSTSIRVNGCSCPSRSEKRRTEAADNNVISVFLARVAVPVARSV
ncbi:hypothetical protein M0R45_010216 [Rubus argutus]|uniref:Uncharacterized protein n=1 Tax=Rubus argutus TaxID=59490 RepID=A0AAW1Y6D1_RUBAR